MRKRESHQSKDRTRSLASLRMRREPPSALQATSRIQTGELSDEVEVETAPTGAMRVRIPVPFHRGPLGARANEPGKSMSAKVATLKPPVGDADHRLGQANAPITLVEYGDYQCPHCARAHPRVAALLQRFGDRLTFVFRNFPLAESHPEAFHAAEAAESVAAHSGAESFWKMHDLIFEHQQDDLDALDDAHLGRYAEAAGASAARVQEDLDDGVYGERVREDFMSGVRSGVNGTPTFFINGTRYDGDWQTVDVFAEAIEAASGIGK